VRRGQFAAGSGGVGSEPVACDLCGWKATSAISRAVMDDDGVPGQARTEEGGERCSSYGWQFDPNKGDACFR